MLYPKTNTALTSEEFFNPSSEYRGAPFWAWNTKLEKDDLLFQIGCLKKMGMGGFHIHSRTGMATPYLGPEFMELALSCTEEARRLGMLCWLYDEDRWPSGFGGGLVTRNRDYRSRYIVFTPFFRDGTRDYTATYYNRTGSTPHGTGTLLAAYRVRLKDGILADYERVDPQRAAEDEHDYWYAYMEISPERPWFNNQTYVDVLNRQATEKFISVTHEKYRLVLKDYFGSTVPAIFTDEPQMVKKNTLAFAGEKNEVTIPFTDGLDEAYTGRYGESLFERLPELFWELPGDSVSVARYRYHDFLTERFAESFSDVLGRWCDDNGIMLTGHVLYEETLGSQTIAVGEAMRHYRGFALPGIDMLQDRRELTTAKQAQSAAHQYGRPGVLSELYGVTNWDFDFRRHKLQGDWQAALGVTVRVHHLSMVSMAGEAKRDYPASINYQSPWYEKYSYIEDHFARVNTALTRGAPLVKVGVIHPIESYWLRYGPSDQTAGRRQQLEENFQNITRWLLCGLIDFDFISESLLPELYAETDAPEFAVGEMAYEVVLVPGCETIRSTTLEKLEEFQSKGGTVVFLGTPPRYLDAVPSDRVSEFSLKCSAVSLEREKILTALEPFRTVDVAVVDSSSPNMVRHAINPFGEAGERAQFLFYQMRQEGDTRWLFLCNNDAPPDRDLPADCECRIKMAGEFSPVVYDTLSGEITEIDCVYDEGSTLISYRFSYHDSLLLRLDSGRRVRRPVVRQAVPAAADEMLYLRGPVQIELSEPNVLLLDMAEYRFDGGDWQAPDELLRVDNTFRSKLGWPLRTDDFAQPWTNEGNETTEHRLDLRFAVNSRIDVASVDLALEEAEVTEISWNGESVRTETVGWFVDKAIKRVHLGRVRTGENELRLSIPYSSRTNIEWCYLLGDFGVRVAGETAEIIEPVRKLHFGDWVHQGLPFYAGNVTCFMPFESPHSDIVIRMPQYRGALITVGLDDGEDQELVFSPYRARFNDVPAGRHVLKATIFGNRVNAFGAVHSCHRSMQWFGPDAWRTEGDRWTYAYQLKPMGLLVPPSIDVIEK